MAGWLTAPLMALNRYISQRERETELAHKAQNNYLHDMVNTRDSNFHFRSLSMVDFHLLDIK